METTNEILIFQLILYASITNVLGELQCVGTCYSGRTFPKPDDIIKGKCLYGFSYRNITTDDPKKCYSSCINDCRCNACQMKGTICELLDFDKTYKSVYFKDKSGYTYYDLQQSSYKGIESHMVLPGKCYNGCCRSQPCMNGGTCAEHCDSPLEKFICKCPNRYTGRVCEKFITICSDLMKYSSPNNVPAKTIYTLTRSDNGVMVQVYCDFTFLSNRSWTLIESFSFANRKAFKHLVFFTDAPRNQDQLNFDDYRMSLDMMTYIRARSTKYRAACSKDDFFIGKLRDFDPLIPDDSAGVCFKYGTIKIRGHKFKNGKIAIYQVGNKYHLHVDASIASCGFPSVPNSLRSEDAFGYYNDVNPQSSCTKTAQSTTQWWLGRDN